MLHNLPLTPDPRTLNAKIACRQDPADKASMTRGALSAWVVWVFLPDPARLNTTHHSGSVEEIVIMGAYYGVNQVKKLGIEHRTHGPIEVQAGNSVIVVLDNGLYQIAVDVTKRSEFNEFYGQYNTGDWLTFKLYVIATSMLEQCPNVGRVPSIRNELVQAMTNRKSRVAGIPKRFK